MMALRFNVPGQPMADVLKQFSVYESCGAQVYAENEGNTVIVQFPEDQFEIIRHCVEGKLDSKGKALLEHAIASWDMQYNFYLDMLAEEHGFDKSDPETRKEALDMAYSDITGNLPPGEFKLGSGSENGLALVLVSEGPNSAVREYKFPHSFQYTERFINPDTTFVVNPDSVIMFSSLEEADRYFDNSKNREYKLNGPEDLNGTLTLTIMKFVPATIIEKGGEFEMPEMAEQYFGEEINELVQKGFLNHKKGNTYIFTDKGVRAMGEYTK